LLPDCITWHAQVPLGVSPFRGADPTERPRTQIDSVDDKHDLGALSALPPAGRRQTAYASSWSLSPVHRPSGPRFPRGGGCGDVWLLPLWGVVRRSDRGGAAGGMVCLSQQRHPGPKRGAPGSQCSATAHSDTRSHPTGISSLGSCTNMACSGPVKARTTLATALSSGQHILSLSACQSAASPGCTATNLVRTLSAGRIRSNRGLWSSALGRTLSTEPWLLCAVHCWLQCRPNSGLAAG
jgi:hypothetical protein